MSFGNYPCEIRGAATLNKTYCGTCKWLCKECGEPRVGDARVLEGMKCVICAYGHIPGG